MTACTLYDNLVGYNESIVYNGVCVSSDCTLYNDSVAYNAAILYDGECISPPVPVSPRRGGVHYRIYREIEDPRRRREDEEILILRPGRH